MQIVELHFTTEPELDYLAIKARAEALLGGELDASDSDSTENAFLLFHKEHPIQLSDAMISPQTVILRASKPFIVEDYADDIQQSWQFRDCSTVLANSRHTLLVTEMMAQSLPAKDRVHLFHGVLQAVIELTKPIALVFKHSQQIVQPQMYLDSVGDLPILRPGSLNVRFYNISNSSDEMLMDTRGLSEIGLTDLQCHFRDLDLDAVGNVLFNGAVYLFENGMVIESGNTIEGTEKGSKWICQFENALAPPEREVLDLNPGPPYAAGRR